MSVGLVTVTTGFLTVTTGLSYRNCNLARPLTKVMYLTPLSPSPNTLRCHSAGSSYGPNERERQPRRCTQINDHRQKMQAGSSVAVWE